MDKRGESAIPDKIIKTKKLYKGASYDDNNEERTMKLQDDMILN